MSAFNKLSVVQPDVAAQARAAADMARQQAQASADMARAQGDAIRAQADLLRARADQLREGNATSITTSPDGRTTTIDENGKKTVISTDENGQVTITQDGNATTVGGPGADVIEQLAERAAHAEVPPFGPDMFRDEIPHEVIPLVSIVFGLTAATIVLFPFARAFGRRLERRWTPPAAAPETAMRLDRIESAIETMAIEMERVSEAQRYSARLLTERLPDPAGRTTQSVEAMPGAIPGAAPRQLRESGRAVTPH